VNQQLKIYIDRIDAMTLRERSMVFLGVAFSLVMALQTWLLDPLLARQKKLSTQIVQQQEQIKLVQLQIQALLQPKKQDEDALNRSKVADLRAQLALLDRQIGEKQKQFVAPEKVAAMLENMLKNNRRLELMSLRNLPGGSMAQAGAAPAGNAAAGTREIFRHAIELSVRGDYFDLLEFLAALERMKEQVFWGGIEFTVAEHPKSVLKLTIYTLSLEKSWLTV